MSTERIGFGGFVRARSRELVCLPAATAAVVLIGGIAVGAHGGTPHPERSTTPFGPVPVPRPGGPDPHYAATVSYLGAMLAQTPVVPGAQRLGASPAPALADPVPNTGPTPHLITRTEWFRVPATPVDVLAHYAAHHPSGLVPDRGPTAGLRVSFVSGSSPTNPRFVSASLTVAIVAVRGGADVAVTASAIWLSSHAPDSLVARPGHVDVTAQVRDGSRTTVVHRALGLQAANRLAALLNTLPRADGVALQVPFCPTVRNSIREDLVFRTPTGARHAVVVVTCPAHVVLFVPGSGREHLVAGVYGHGVADAVRREAGLPAVFGG